MLADEHALVRQVGVEGTCRILTLFWELIPSRVTLDFIKRLADQLAFDARSEFPLPPFRRVRPRLMHGVGCGPLQLGAGARERRGGLQVHARERAAQPRLAPAYALPIVTSLWSCADRVIMPFLLISAPGQAGPARARQLGEGAHRHGRAPAHRQDPARHEVRPPAPRP